MSSNNDTFQGDEQGGVDECLQQFKKNGILHEDQSKDGKADNAGDQEVSAIKRRGRGKKEVFNKNKFYKICAHVWQMGTTCSVQLQVGTMKLSCFLQSRRVVIQ